jgi:hypothetical protein
MAKGQVSEEELTKGLKGIGNFGGLSPKVQRDNPFRDSRSDRPEPAKTIEVRLPASEPRVAKAAKPEPKPVRTLQSPKTPSRGRAENLRSEEGSARKADVFTERVTLQISPEMRDDIDALARDLQRAKTTREERITANTVMRVALQVLMTNYQFERGDVANNEAELYDLVVRRFRKK